MDSNLATVINILALENLNEFETKYEINDFVWQSLKILTIKSKSVIINIRLGKPVK